MNNQLITQNEKREEYISQVADLNESVVLDFTRKRLENGDNPLEIAQDCQEGLRIVGEMYEQQKYFLAGLIMGGEIFRQVMDLIQPSIENRFHKDGKGKILIGTVQGDIHDIGKNNFITLLNSFGFTVLDLGVDVPPAEFLDRANSFHPDIIGLSGLLTSAYDSMKETIKLIRRSEDDSLSTTPIIIGGNQLTEQVSLYVGANYWATDAMAGVRYCQELLNN
jgi:methanogenic corrinoid protein MtbC1